VIRNPCSRTSFLVIIILVLAVAVGCASTSAKLSMYDPPGSRSQLAAKATKLHQCNLEPVSVTPLAYVVMLISIATNPPVRVELADRFLF